MTGGVGPSGQGHWEARCNCVGLVITSTNLPHIRNVPGTPPTNNTRQQHLFRVVGDIWAKRIDCPPIVAISVRGVPELTSDYVLEE